ncbi:ArsR/SmtB family transcription factor [Bradyrhizobium brasilense]|uniref:ArsR/SmtB family transcription factor n=1 Tax=Bradyrhizobium brasilense TaxID=1419277 RepID=UPI001E64EAFA|nr:helix-turn-helix transcriptional regulator [Bradyrhizobium brasilense]
MIEALQRHDVRKRKGHISIDAEPAMQTIAPELAELAGLIADPGRASILSRLMDGRPQTASELALVAGVTPQTASWHLSRMVERALLKVERRGPRRFYRLATPLVAQMLEGMMTVAAIDPHPSQPPPRIDPEMPGSDLLRPPCRRARRRRHRRDAGSRPSQSRP